MLICVILLLRISLQLIVRHLALGIKCRIPISHPPAPRHDVKNNKKTAHHG